MVMQSHDIQHGMTVYGSDGQKIGTVRSIHPSGMEEAGAGQGTYPGGTGTLGNESQVGATPANAGTLGNESEVRDAGYGGGEGVLGDESQVGGAGGQVPSQHMSDTGPRSAEVSASAPPMGGGTAEGDVVIVEEVDVVGVVSGAGASGVGAGGTGPGYFDVDHGGFLGLGTKHLHVPFSAVQEVNPGDSVTLDCTAQECANRYQTHAS